MNEKTIPINKLFFQTKQRVDMQLDFSNFTNNQPVASLTKLYFNIINDDNNFIKEKISDYNNRLTKGSSNKESNLSSLNINLDLTQDYQVREDIDFKKYMIELNLQSDNCLIQYIDIEYYNDDLINKNNNKKLVNSSKNTRLMFNYLKPELQDSYIKSVFSPCFSSSCFTNTSRVSKFSKFIIYK